MKLLKKVRVKNKMGLHARPATEIVKLLQKTESQVTFTFKKQVVNAKSMLNILMLAAPNDSQITITVEGLDAEQVLNSLTIMFENKFEEKH